MQFGRGCHLWGRVCPLPSSSGCRLPASLPLLEDGPVRCWLAFLWYSLVPLFCERARQCLRLELFMGKFSLSLFLLLIFFFFSLSLFLSFSLAIPQFGLLSHISFLRLPSGHSGLVLALSNAVYASLFSPYLLVADASIWATSPLGVAVRRIISGVYLFFPSSYAAL